MTRQHIIVVEILLFIIYTPKQATGQYYLKYEDLADELTKTHAFETGEAFQYVDVSISFKLPHRSMPVKGTESASANNCISIARRSVNL